MNTFKAAANRIQMLVRHVIVSVLVALAGVGTAHAAQCSVLLSTPATVSFGTITVPRDAPVGAAIGPEKPSTIGWSCSSAYVFNLQALSALPVSSVVPTVWETGMPGIGVRVTDRTDGSNLVLSNVAAPLGTTFGQVNSPTGVTTAFNFFYQLVKTADVTGSGSLVVPKVFNLASQDVAANTTSPILGSVGINATIVVSTCTVTTPSIAVTLPTMPTNELRPVGATGGNTAFQIGLSCGSGTNVYVTLTDATTPSNQTDELSLASDSTASGVRLRILKQDGSPVSFGPDSSLPGNPNQWLVGVSGSTSSIPLKAQYIATDFVTAGKVKASATFTLSYQ